MNTQFNSNVTWLQLEYKISTLPTYPNNAKAFYHSDNNTIFGNVAITEYSFSIPK